MAPPPWSWLAIAAVTAGHLYFAPFTKVEESFSVQAIHDIAIHGLPLGGRTENAGENYDYVHFPGPVPRSFLGPVLVAYLSHPIPAWITRQLGRQVTVRAIVAIYNLICLWLFQQDVQAGLGGTTAGWFGLLYASQFRVNYYASRPVPNMFAYGVVVVGLGRHIRSLGLADRLERWNLTSQAVNLLAFAAAVWRAEIAVLLAAVGIGSLINELIATTGVNRNWTNLQTFVCFSLPFPVLVGLAQAMIASIQIDSTLWKLSDIAFSDFALARFTPAVVLSQLPRAGVGLLEGWVWPELAAFQFNAVEGRSAEWGVQSWHFYFSSAIPWTIVNPVMLLVLIPVGVFANAKCRYLLAEAVMFASVMSVLGHKEWRFIIYLAPLLTVIAAVGASRLGSPALPSLRIPSKDVFKHKTTRAISSTVVAISIAFTLLFSVGSLYISTLNYPGGSAFTALRHHISTQPGPSSPPQSTSPLRVYADNLVCQTGLTRFLSDPIILNGDPASPVKLNVDKSLYSLSTLANSSFIQANFDYIVAEHALFGSTAVAHSDTVELVEDVLTFDGVKIEYVTDLETGIRKDQVPVDAADNQIKSMLCRQSFDSANGAVNRLRQLCHTGFRKLRPMMPSLSSSARICDICWLSVNKKKTVGIWRVVSDDGTANPG